MAKIKLVDRQFVPEVETRVIKPDRLDELNIGATAETTEFRRFDQHLTISESDFKELELLFIELMN